MIEYNSIVLGAQMREAGGEFTRWAALPDDADAIRAAILEATADHDLVLVLAGSSAGSKDFTARVVRETGTLLVHGVAVRPGHPVIMGMVNDIPVIGVPGYPVSAALTGEIFIRPLLLSLAGADRAALRAHQSHADTQSRFTHRRRRFCARDGWAGRSDRTLVTPLSRGAGVITSLVRADGLLHIPRFSEGLNIGSEVEVLLYRSPEDIARTVVVVGSHDPMLDLLGQYLARAFSRLPAGVGQCGQPGRAGRAEARRSASIRHASARSRNGRVQCRPISAARWAICRCTS